MFKFFAQLFCQKSFTFFPSFHVIVRNDQDAYFHGDDGSSSFGSGINLSEAELVPYGGDRGTGAGGLACRMVDSEMLQLPLTR